MPSMTRPMLWPYGQSGLTARKTGRAGFSVWSWWTSWATVSGFDRTGTSGSETGRGAGQRAAARWRRPISAA
nr:hypothetical protein [Streptomyces tsukubensis NRRL18488]